MMKKFSIAIGVAALAVSGAASAHDTTIPYPTRGACETASAQTSNEEKDWLVVSFPDLFGTRGEAASFLTKAWTCDLSSSDGEYYITDHRLEVLDSRWFQQRNH